MLSAKISLFRPMLAFLALVALLLIGTSNAFAANNVAHYTLSFSEESTMEIPTGTCGLNYPASITEYRSYQLRVTEFVDGPKEGMMLINGVIIGDFTIFPTGEATGVTYEGSYREKVVVSGTALLEEDGGMLRVGTFTLPATAIGSDGSVLKFLLHGHLVSGKDGEVKVDFEKLNCIKP
jgi:hypothetical protein